MKRGTKTLKKGGCQVKVIYLAFIMKKLLINQLLEVAFVLYLMMLVYGREMSKECYSSKDFLN